MNESRSVTKASSPNHRPMTPRLFPIGPGIVVGLAIVSGAWFLREGVIEGVAVPWEGAMWPMPIFRCDDAIMYGATSICFVELLEVLAEECGTRTPQVEQGAADWRQVLSSKLVAMYSQRLS